MNRCSNSALWPVCVHVCEHLCVCAGGLECLKQTQCVLEIRGHTESTEQYSTPWTQKNKTISQDLRQRVSERERTGSWRKRINQQRRTPGIPNSLRHMQRGNGVRTVKYNKRREEWKNKRMIVEGREKTHLFPGRPKESNQKFMMSSVVPCCFWFELFLLLTGSVKLLLWQPNREAISEKTVRKTEAGVILGFFNGVAQGGLRTSQGGPWEKSSAPKQVGWHKTTHFSLNK